MEADAWEARWRNKATVMVVVVRRWFAQRGRDCAMAWVVMGGDCNGFPAGLGEACLGGAAPGRRKGVERRQRSSTTVLAGREGRGSSEEGGRELGARARETGEVRGGGGLFATVGK